MGFIPLRVREHRELVRVIANFWLLCALAMSRTPFAMMYYSCLQLAVNRPFNIGAFYITIYDVINLVIHMELHSSEGKGYSRKRTSDRARTRDLRSIAEFQPREPRRPVEILRPLSLLCTDYRCAAIQRHLRPAP